MEARPSSALCIPSTTSTGGEAPRPVAEIREAVRQAGYNGSATTLQCTLAAAAQAVNRAIERETAAASAALSLAQRQSLESMRADLCAAAEELESALNAQGRRLLSPASSAGGWSRFMRWGSRSVATPSWWAALDETLATLDTAVSHLVQISETQPSDTPARAVAEATAQLLREHHHRLSRHAELQPA